MKKVLYAVVVIVGLLGAAWAADTWARGQAVETIRAAAAESTGADPEVTVTGFPFLTQLAAGEMDLVEVTIAEMSLSGVRFEGVQLEARGVATDPPHRIAALTATGLVPIAEVNRLFGEASNLDAEVVVDGDAVALTGEVLGLELGISFLLEPADGGITLVPDAVSVAGRSLDLSALGGWRSALSAEVTLPIELPEGMRLAAVEPAPGGVLVRVEGMDVIPEPAMFR